MIVFRGRAKTAKPSLTLIILQWIVFTSVGLTAYFLYTKNWTVDENTTGLLVILNISAFTPFIYWLPIESVRNGRNILRILYQVMMSYAYTACLFGFIYKFSSDVCADDRQPFKPPLHGFTTGFQPVYSIGRKFLASQTHEEYPRLRSASPVLS
jgi:hypothetical protein